MRRLLIAASTLVVLSISPVTSAEKKCLIFKDVGSEAKLKLASDWTLATLTREGERPALVPLGRCGEGRIGRCARSKDETRLSTLVPVFGWLYIKGDQPATHFVVVDGTTIFEEACEPAD